MKNKWLVLIGLAIMSILVFTACGTDEETNSSDSNSTEEDAGQEEQDEAANEEESEQAEESDTYTIGASQIVEHPSLDAAYQGFQDAIADAGLEVEYDYQSAQNDTNNTKPIADGFVADNVDLIFANSTPSAQAAVAATEDTGIPVIFTSVTDAVGADLVDAMDQPGENVTGVVDLHPDSIKNTVNFIDTYFENSVVGFIYNQGEPNSVAQVEAIKAEIEDTSLTTAESVVASSSEVNQAAESLVGEADVFYIFTDNTVVDALQAVIGVANEQDIPMVVGEPNSVEQGGFATYGIDYHTIGKRAGEMAVEVLTGEKTTSDIPVEIPPEMQLFINKEAAEEQGIEWNPDWDEQAQFLETVEEE